MQTNSTPSLSEFDPSIIPFQHRVIKDIRQKFDYRLGTHEILLSGSVGSAKSLLIAHIVVSHCLFNAGAKFMIGRLSMPALRATIFNKIIEHIGPDLKEGRDYWVNQTTAGIKFRNGSEIISRSWADRKFFKVRSLELSGVAIEETVETKERDFYDEIKMRVGRLPHIKENIILHATNPSDPSHWCYKHFIGSQPHDTRHVYYSVTTDNPFLPPQYIDQLKRDLDPKMARRMIFGEWIEIAGEIIYYAYEAIRNYRNEDYKLHPDYPIHLMWDFNIGEGKPMSCALGQFISDIWHIFDEVIIHGARTAGVIEEIEEKGYFSPNYRYIINGDAAGKHKDTRNSRSDYDIIFHELGKRNLRYEYHVPAANPGIRNRHNIVNAYCFNDLNQSRLLVYRKAKTVHEGFRLTKLKKGASYLEDDSKHYQHVTTAIGYGVHYENMTKTRKPQGSVQL